MKLREALARCPLSYSVGRLRQKLGLPPLVEGTSYDQLFIVKSVLDAKEFESLDAARAAADSLKSQMPDDDEHGRKAEFTVAPSGLHKRRFVVKLRTPAGLFMIGIAPVVGGKITVPRSAT